MGKETRSVERRGANGELRERVASAVSFVKDSGYRFRSLGMLDEIAGLVENGKGDSHVSSQALVTTAIGQILKDIGHEDFRPEFYVWDHERGEFEVKIVRS